MKTYSLDLRERVVAKVDAGELSREEAARLFCVSVSWIKKLFAQRRRLGHVAPLPHGGGRRPLLNRSALQAAVAEAPLATLAELRERVRGPGRRRVGLPAISRALARLGLARKKGGDRGQRAR